MPRETVERKRQALEDELKSLKAQRDACKKRKTTRLMKGWFGVLSGLMMVLVSGHLALGVHTAWAWSFFEAWLAIVSILFLLGAGVAIVWGLILVLCQEKFGCGW